MIYVIRHGQTDLNKEGRLQGRQGLQLNEFGIEQAKSLRERLKDIKFNLVYSSPQRRAIQTAEIATGMKAIIDNKLDVFDLGEADTLKRGEVKMAGVVPDSSVYRGVEDINSFIKRIFEFMHQLQDAYGTKDVNILLSGHRCTTGCIGAYFEGIPKDGNVLRYSSDNGHFKIYKFN
ncbi:histidine phosphatase family protein [Candidatus Pristimantibacillus sp. PTI5]|uniref:histidine phosphatase family protein n=1 Tax=Candidatus Pristimantibacillus sp. PTI5 TaxID=3400422 RepID=UPI003B01BDB1